MVNTFERAFKIIYWIVYIVWLIHMPIYECIPKLKAFFLTILIWMNGKNISFFISLFFYFFISLLSFFYFFISSLLNVGYRLFFIRTIDRLVLLPLILFSWICMNRSLARCNENESVCLQYQWLACVPNAKYYVCMCVCVCREKGIWQLARDSWNLWMNCVFGA